MLCLAGLVEAESFKASEASRWRAGSLSAPSARYLQVAITVQCGLSIIERLRMGKFPRFHSLLATDEDG